MIPIPRMVQYGNVVPQAGVVLKVETAVNNQLYTVLLTTSGKLWAIGANNSGMFGTGNTNPLTSWTLIATNVKNFWSDAISNSGVLLYIKNDDTWWCSGLTTPIGINSTAVNVFTDRTSNFNAITYSNINSLQLTYNNISIVTNDGNLYTGGVNTEGRLGDGTTTFGTFKIRPDVGTGNIQKALFARSVTTYYVLLTDGTLLGSGTGGSGQLGALATRTTFGTVTTGALDLFVGSGNFYIKKSDGYYACGANTLGQNGNNQTSSFISTPTLIPTIGIPDYFYAGLNCAITYNVSTTQYYVWGSNSNGKLGLGTGVSSYNVPTLHDKVQLPAFDHVPSLFNYGWFTSNSNAYILGSDKKVYITGLSGTHTPGVTSTAVRFTAITLPSPL